MALRVKPIGRRQAARDGERGAMLIQAAITFIGLLALTTFVVDFGVMWTSRRQAQNAADAGALAGVTAMAYDSYTDRTNNGPAKQSAYLIATQHTVWGSVPSVNIDTDVTFPTCRDGSDGCIRVDVYRNESHGNPLPILFGALVGLTGQGVQATATGEVLVGNASNCIKPWVIPDKWQENSSPANNTFDKYVKSGNTVTTISNPDVYIPPSTTSSGTGYSPEPAPTGQYGTLLTLKAGSPSTAIQPGFFYPVDLPLPPAGATITGGSQYRTNIATCTNWPVKIGDYLPPENGNMVGPTKQGVADLIAEDPGAYFDPTTKTIKGSCAPNCGTQSNISPRVIAIALVDPDALSLSMIESGGKNLVLHITNILGFFINSQSSSGDVTGYIFSYPGMTVGTPTIGPGEAFLFNPVLVR